MGERRDWALLYCKNFKTYVAPIRSRPESKEQQFVLDTEGSANEKRQWKEEPLERFYRSLL